MTSGLPARTPVLVTAVLALLFALQPPHASAQPPEEPLFLEDGWEMTFHLVPVQYWDTADGPHGHELPEGTVRLYRPGTYEPAIVGAAGEPILLPPGRWIWVAEAPGYVSTFTNTLPVAPGDRQQRSLTVPMTPACRFTLTGDRRWQGLDRLDVVSLDEAAVYPILPGEREEFWIPQGNHLAYGVQRGGIIGITPIGHCRQLDDVPLSYPEPPTPQRQSLLVSANLPETLDRALHGDLLVELQDPRIRAENPPVVPSAQLFQGRTVVSFFLDVPAEDPYRLSLRHPHLRTRSEPLLPEPGAVQEIGVGPLLARRDLDVSVDYRPARPHDTARLDLRYCGPDRADNPPILLLDECGDPLAEHTLQPGFHTYTFHDLDDGQYLASATVDGEVIPGLGQRVKPYLEPDSEAVPPVVAQLTEMHVHGRLLRDDEAVPGVVRLVPWERDSGIPSRSLPTDDRDEYHLYYFARHPTAGEVTHFPEELQDRSPAELPGLYCCFELSACSDTGACRTFNIHSNFTGEGRFDIELPGTERVEIRALDAATGQPLPQARMLVQPSPAFHFVDGDVLWFEAAGMEPDGLDADEDGTVVWLPPEPGEHRIIVRAPEYATASATVDVPPGGETSLTVELQPERYTQGSRFVFADSGAPVANGQLLAFDDDGASVTRCQTTIDTEGYAAPTQACADHRFLLVHPWAALQVIPGHDVTGSAYVEVRPRPPFPPRLRLVDPAGEPVRDAFVQIRIDDLTVTPDDLFAAATAGVPYQASNAVGEIVLHGLDSRELFGVEVSPWVPFEEDWTSLDDGRSGPLELTVERPE